MINYKNKKIEISLHVLVWMVLFFLPLAFSIGSDINWQDLFRHFWLHLFLLAIIFYTNYLVFIRRFFEQHKLYYFSLNLLFILSLIFIKHQLFEFFTQGLEHIDKKGPPTAFIYFMDMLIYTIPVAFALAINAGNKIQKAEELKIEADNIKLQSELQLLKYQLQPHFFFNALNTIYSMVDFAPDKAKQGIHSLSKLMRHLLYKSNVDKIKLAEEVEFLHKYIELMRLRMTDHTKINIDFPQKIPEVTIAPLLFIAIVENAFKHGISATQESVIHFKMQIQDRAILFKATNTNFPKSTADKSGSGIGLENLQKRLNLLYPHQHDFKTYVSKKTFTAELKIITVTP